MTSYGATAVALGVSETGGVSPLELSAAVRDGLPVSALDRVVGVVSPGDTGLRYRLVPKASLARRKGGALSAPESERLARLARVWALAVEVWKTEEGARGFLNRPHLLLGDRTPLDVILESEIGASAVEDVLNRLQYGVAV